MFFEADRKHPRHGTDTPSVVRRNPNTKSTRSQSRARTHESGPMSLMRSSVIEKERNIWKSASVSVQNFPSKSKQIVRKMAQNLLHNVRSQPSAWRGLDLARQPP